jgi:hypothetical protein
LSFAAMLQRNDAQGACDLARGAAERTLHCSRQPRIPKWLRTAPRERPKVVDVTPADVKGAVRLGLVPGPPLLAIEVNGAGHVVYLTGYGYA